MKINRRKNIPIKKEPEELILLTQTYLKPIKFKEMDVVKAIQETDGYITYTAKKLKCTYNTLKNFIEKSKTCQEALLVAKECILDLAEKTLVDKMRDGNLDATKFYLTSKGKERGYGNPEVDIVKFAKPITFNYRPVITTVTNEVKQETNGMKQVNGIEERN